LIFNLIFVYIDLINSLFVVWMIDWLFGLLVYELFDLIEFDFGWLLYYKVFVIDLDLGLGFLENIQVWC
jgi:hypothetical protein